MTSVRIDPEFEKLIPPQTAEELDLLTKSCVEYGIRDALITWNGILLDGHTRYRIAMEHDLEFRVEEMEFNSREDAKNWMIYNQLGRRNLHPDGISILRGSLQGEEKQSKGGDRKSKPQSEALISGKTSSKIGEQFGVGHATIERDEQFADAAKALDAHGFIDISTVGIGQSPLTKQDTVELAKIVQEDPEKAKEIFSKIESDKSKNIKEALKTIKKQDREEQDAELSAMTLSLPKTDRIRIIHSSVADLSSHIEPGTVDCIITDPPYPREYLYTWEDLAIMAKHVLKPGGIVAAMSGQSYLPEIHEMMSRHLTYRWEMAYLTPGGTLTVWQPRVMTGWKPILVYSNGKIDPDCDMLWDVVKSERQDKDFHEWGQSVSGLSNLVEVISKPGDIVLDPFVGGGSTAIACMDLNRRFIGADSELQEVNKTILRIDEHESKETIL